MCVFVSGCSFKYRAGHLIMFPAVQTKPEVVDSEPSRLGGDDTHQQQQQLLPEVSSAGLQLG